MTVQQLLPTDLLTGLDSGSPVPLYHQIALRLEDAISRGVLQPGVRIESEVALAKRLNISRPTLSKAIGSLVSKGLLVRQKGVGTQVVRGQEISRNIDLTSLWDDLSKTGQRPRTRVISRALEAATEEESAEFGVVVGTELVRLRRIRFVGELPIALLDNLLPASCSDITTADLEAHGLYELLRSRGVYMRIARQQISARNATTEESEYLALHDGAPVLTMSRRTLDSTGRIVDLGRHAYSPELYSFQVSIVDS